MFAPDYKLPWKFRFRIWLQKWFSWIPWIGKFFVVIRFTNMIIPSVRRPFPIIHREDICSPSLKEIMNCPIVQKKDATL